jgi:hypothetical protein
MNRHDVRTENDAFLYITDCLLATVSHLAMLKSRKKNDYDRHVNIAQHAINWIMEFKMDVPTSDRAHDVIYKCGGFVNRWAAEYEVNV